MSTGMVMCIDDVDEAFCDHIQLKPLCDRWGAQPDDQHYVHMRKILHLFAFISLNLTLPAQSQIEKERDKIRDIVKEPDVKLQEGKLVDFLNHQKALYFEWIKTRTDKKELGPTVSIRYFDQDQLEIGPQSKNFELKNIFAILIEPGPGPFQKRFPSFVIRNPSNDVFMAVRAE